MEYLYWSAMFAAGLVITVAGIFTAGFFYGKVDKLLQNRSDGSAEE